MNKIVLEFKLAFEAGASSQALARLRNIAADMDADGYILISESINLEFKHSVIERTYCDGAHTIIYFVRVEGNHKFSRSRIATQDDIQRYRESV